MTTTHHLESSSADMTPNATPNTSFDTVTGALPVLDFNVILRLKSFDPEGKRGLVRRLVSIYLESAPRDLAEIRRCHTDLAKQDLRRLAHRLKTSNANLGLQRMFALFEELEQRLVADSTVESGLLPYSVDLITLIESEGARAIEAVRSL
jgi:HPt (histidine-containing phosphotransfer) domain-containing protein